MANTCDCCGDSFPSTAALVQHFGNCSAAGDSGEGERVQQSHSGEKETRKEVTREKETSEEETREKVARMLAAS